MYPSNRVTVYKSSNGRLFRQLHDAWDTFGVMNSWHAYRDKGIKITKIHGYLCLTGKIVETDAECRRINHDHLVKKYVRTGLLRLGRLSIEERKFMKEKLEVVALNRYSNVLYGANINSIA